MDSLEPGARLVADDVADVASSPGGALGRGAATPITAGSREPGGNYPCTHHAAPPHTAHMIVEQDNAIGHTASPKRHDTQGTTHQPTEKVTKPNLNYFDGNF